MPRNVKARKSKICLSFTD